MTNEKFIEKFFLSIECLGPKHPTLSNKFIHYVNRSIYHAGSSPIYLKPNTELTIEDISHLDKTIAPDLPDNNLASSVPYFAILDIPELYDIKRIRETVKNARWITDETMHVCGWDEIIPSDLKNDFKIETGNLKDKNISNRINRLFRKSFGIPDDVADDVVNGMSNTVTENLGSTYGVMISHKGEDVACGSVLVIEDTGYLGGATVIESFRGKGLWKALVSERQKISRKDGANYWFYKTWNPLIIEKAEMHFKQYTFYRLEGMKA